MHPTIARDKLKAILAADGVAAEVVEDILAGRSAYRIRNVDYLAEGVVTGHISTVVVAPETREHLREVSDAEANARLDRIFANRTRTPVTPVAASTPPVVSDKVEADASADIVRSAATRAGCEAPLLRSAPRDTHAVETDASRDIANVAFSRSATDTSSEVDALFTGYSNGPEAA